MVDSKDGTLSLALACATKRLGKEGAHPLDAPPSSPETWPSASTALNALRIEARVETRSKRKRGVFPVEWSIGHSTISTTRHPKTPHRYLSPIGILVRGKPSTLRSTQSGARAAGQTEPEKKAPEARDPTVDTLDTTRLSSELPLTGTVKRYSSHMLGGDAPQNSRSNVPASSLGGRSRFGLEG